MGIDHYGVDHSVVYLSYFKWNQIKAKQCRKKQTNTIFFRLYYYNIIIMEF